MSEKNRQSISSSYSFTMYDTPKKDLKSSLPGRYYNSVDYSNHNFQGINFDGKNGENLEKSTSKRSSSLVIKTYKRRFAMLFLASFCSMMNAVPQFQYAVIADIVACYYDVTVTAADWTSIVYMVAFLPFVFPVMYFMEKKGLRNTVIVGAFLNFLGKIFMFCYNQILNICYLQICIIYIKIRRRR